MNRDETQLSDALIELAKLRERDERLRRISEAIACALEALNAEDDPQDGPGLLLEQLALALGSPHLCLCPLSWPSPGEEPIFRGEPSPLERLVRAPRATSYLARRPFRAIAEPGALAAALGSDSGLEGLPSLLSGTLRTANSPPWLLLCAGGRRQLEQEGQELFRRFLPIFSHALRRLLDSRAVKELRRNEQEMVIAKERAETASRAKSEFVSRMSHELRTPLNAIIGFTQLLREEQLSAAQNEYARLIGSAGDHLLGLVNTVLDLASIEAGQLRLEERSFDLRESLESVASIAAEQARAKGLHFSMTLDPSLPPYLQGDPTRLRQVLINLLANAIKFTRKGEVSLGVAIQEERLEFSVSDTGIGIAPESQRRLFQPFSQADESIAQRFGGTGLGLLISRQCVTAMGGDIEVESALGVGTRFRAWIPVRLPHDAGGKPAALASGPGASAPPAERVPLSGLRVLVVDDNAVNRRLAGLMLGRLGLSPRCVDSGPAALAVLENESFSLVLMDIEMPDMDGLTTTAFIREAERRRGARPTPVVAMTACVLDEDRKRFLSSGLDGFTPKPIVLGDLRAEIERVLSASAPRTPPRASLPAPPALSP